MGAVVGFNLALFPGLPHFLFFSLRHTEAEECEKQGSPGNTYHVNDVWWTWGGRREEGSTFKWRTRVHYQGLQTFTRLTVLDSVIDAPRPSLVALFRFHLRVLYWTQTEEQKGRQGLGTRLDLIGHGNNLLWWLLDSCSKTFPISVNKATCRTVHEWPSSTWAVLFSIFA